MSLVVSVLSYLSLRFCASLLGTFKYTNTWLMTGNRSENPLLRYRTWHWLLSSWSSSLFRPSLYVYPGLVRSYTDGQNAWQDFSTGRTMASIAGMLPSDVDVLRDGRQMTMPAKELVVGDLVYVTLGDKVSHMRCSCRVVKC
jgi:magnesium-transporting ATPase (P-type)